MTGRKVLTCLGTRPEAIKLGPVVKALAARFGGDNSIVCVTGQHREMLDQTLRLFGSAPAYDLNIMKVDQSLFDVTTGTLAGVRDVIHAERPSVIVVQGDTTTTFAAALAGYYSRIAVAHVEAGLRTYDKFRPFPEEVNRRMTTQIADLHFAPTEAARQNLLREGVPVDSIRVTGNTVVDALLDIVEQQRNPQVDARYADMASKLGVRLPGEPLILVTAHRRESFGEGFRNICLALGELARRNPHIQILYPVHPNPNVQGVVNGMLAGVANIRLCPPIEYELFVYIMSKCRFILTDSGGVQEEAPSLGKPVLVLRTVTERPEAVEAGTAKLVGTEPERIIVEAERLLRDDEYYGSVSAIRNPYGDGRAAPRIVDAIEGFLSGTVSV